MVRRIALNLLREGKTISKLGLKAKRKRCGLEDAYLEAVLGFQCDCPGENPAASTLEFSKESWRGSFPGGAQPLSRYGWGQVVRGIPARISLIPPVPVVTIQFFPP